MVLTAHHKVYSSSLETLCTCISFLENNVDFVSSLQCESKWLFSLSLMLVYIEIFFLLLHLVWWKSFKILLSIKAVEWRENFETISMQVLARGGQCSWEPRPYAGDDWRSQ